VAVIAVGRCRSTAVGGVLGGNRRENAERIVLVSFGTNTDMAIKPKYVKQLATTLLEEYPEAFNTDFETNKTNVSKLTTVESKGVRNRVAGYITRKKAATV
jgi:small subunit ribosomal protein S17e